MSQRVSIAYRHPRHPSLQGSTHTFLRSYTLAHHLYVSLDHPYPAIIRISNLGIHLPTFMGEIALLFPLLCFLASGIRCWIGLGLAETEREEVDCEAAQKEGLVGAKW